MSTLAEKEAMLKFMGTIFGQAKKIDSDVVEGSNHLSNIHRDIQTAFERELRAPRPLVYIPPTPQEIAQTGVVPPSLPPVQVTGTLPTVQSTPEVVPPASIVQPPYDNHSWADRDTPSNVYIGHSTYTPVDSNIEVLRLLNIILDKLKIIELQNGQNTPRKPKSTRTVSRRSTKDK